MAANVRVLRMGRTSFRLESKQEDVSTVPGPSTELRA